MNREKDQETENLIMSRQCCAKKYAALAHTYDCLIYHRDNGLHQCQYEDILKKIHFVKTRVCFPPGPPCGWKNKNGIVCEKTFTHTHRNKQYEPIHSWISRIPPSLELNYDDDDDYEHNLFLL
jgi:hypothetical protein